MNQTQAVSVIDQIYLAIENNELVLPTMPDSAIRIQRMLDDINVSANQIVWVWLFLGKRGVFIKQAVA